MNKNYKNIKKILLTLLGCLVLLNVEGQNMEKHAWQNRILIIKTTDEENTKYQSQLKIFENSIEGLKERKLILYQIVGNRYKLTDYEQLKPNSLWHDLKLIDNIIIDKLTDFEVLLIGLDGGIKLKQKEVLSEKGLYKIIDKMPMRLEEIRSKE